MSKRHDVIGIKQVIRIEWMQKTTNLMLAGVDAKKFDAAFNGFAVDSMVRRFDKQFEQSGLTGVPGVVVNDRYLVETQGLKTLDEYYALVNYLLTLK